MAEFWQVSRKIHVNDLFSFLNSRTDFKSEKEFADFVERNAKDLARDLFEKELGVCIREDDFSARKAFGGRLPRVDFVFEFTDGSRALIECKNVIKNTFNELSRSIGQILAYAALAEENNKSAERLAIFLTDYHKILGSVIRKYNLPIDVFVIGKKAAAKYLYANKASSLHA